MNYSFLIIIMLIAGSCAKGDALSDQKRVNYSLFSSSYDPCLVPNQCTDRKVIPPVIALKIFEASNFKSAPRLGQQVKRSLVITQATTEEVEVDGEVELVEINCAIGYDQIRTLVHIKTNEIYIKEEKQNFKFQPNKKACRDLQNLKEFSPLLIAIEERGDISQDDPLGANQEQLKKLKMETLTLAGKKILRISGVVKTLQVIQDMSFEVEISVLKMFDIGANFFAANIFDHTISKMAGFLPTENIEEISTVSENIDVSSFNLGDFDPSLIDDRRESDN